MDALNQEFIRLFVSSGWKQNQAARELGIAPPTVSQYLSGVTRPSETIIRLFKMLIGDTLPMPGGAVLNDAPNPPDAEERQLLESIRLMPLEARQKMIKGMRLIAEGAQVQIETRYKLQSPKTSKTLGN